MRRAGFGLSEVMVAVAVLAAAFLPLFDALTASREEATDAADFLVLLDALDEGVARTAVDGPVKAVGGLGVTGGAAGGDTVDNVEDAIVVERGQRWLALRNRASDGLAAIAPRREEAE